MQEPDNSQENILYTIFIGAPLVIFVAFVYAVAMSVRYIACSVVFCAAALSILLPWTWEQMWGGPRK